jgi:putative ABC transport system permease protein
VLGEVAPELTLRRVDTMENLVAETLSQQRWSMWLFAALAGLAFLLAAVGIYSVLAYSARSRAREMSVRMALGAAPGSVLRLMIVEGMKPALTGIAAGLGGALALEGLLARFVFGVSPTDPVTFAAVSLLLASVALVACAVPAYRASRVDPATALRGE